ncbi:MAG: PQQ-dependent sugar dehydrogenase [Polyangiales bacterium]
MPPTPAPSTVTRFTALLAALALTACEQTQPAVSGLDAARRDVAAENAPPDAADEAPGDTAPDSASDVPFDATVDADAAADAPQEVVLASPGRASTTPFTESDETNDSRGPCRMVTAGWGPPGATPVHVEVVAQGLATPWSLAFLPDGDLLVVERQSGVRRVHAGAPDPAPLLALDVRPRAGTSEWGAHGIALHPDFARNGLFYVFYCKRDTGNRVERFRLAPDGRSATSDRVIVDGLPTSAYHNGGGLAFGPDGMLYVSTGDGQTPDRAQDVDGPGGKLLRLTPDGATPADNPRPDRPWVMLGIRNSQAFGWLTPDTLFVVDHGPTGELGRGGSDELNVARAGANLGWPAVTQCQGFDGFTRPALTWAAPTPPGGAALYTGTSIPSWRGSLLVGVLGARHLHRVMLDPNVPGRVLGHEVYLDGIFGRIRHVAMGPDGHLYVTTSNCDGRAECPPAGDVILRLTGA